VVVEFSGSHTLGVYVDHNLEGLVKDVFIAGPLAEVRDEFEPTASRGSSCARSISRRRAPASSARSTCSTTPSTRR
jgi:hypothetical protein